MSDETPYREGADEPTEEQQKVESGRPDSQEWFGKDAGDPNTLPPPDPAGDPLQMDGKTPTYPGSQEGEKVFTAVLLVQTHQGVVIPITSLPHINMHHMATPHEVLRMCADVRDQISTARAVGQMMSDMDQRFRFLIEGLRQQGAMPKPPPPPSGQEVKGP